MEIIINSKKYGPYTVLIDDEDYDLFKQYSWYVNYDTRGHFCVRTPSNQKAIKLHRLITGAKKGEQVDHIDGNPLNNKRNNLRICTNKENTKNRQKFKNTKNKYKGVYFRKHFKKNPWQVKIMADYKSFHIGCFSSEIEAAKAYDQAALKYHGPFANLNFPKENS